MTPTDHHLQFGNLIWDLKYLLERGRVLSAANCGSHSGTLKRAEQLAEQLLRWEMLPSRPDYEFEELLKGLQLCVDRARGDGCWKVRGIVDNGQFVIRELERWKASEAQVRLHLTTHRLEEGGAGNANRVRSRIPANGEGRRGWQSYHSANDVS